MSLPRPLPTPRGPARILDPIVQLVCGDGLPGWRFLTLTGCLALVSALGESVMRWVQSIVATSSGWRGDLLPEILWILPLFDLLLFLGIALAALVLARVVPRVGRWVALAVAAALTVVAAYAPLSVWPQLHPAALVLLALGVAVQLLRWLAARPPSAVTLRRSFLGLAGLTVLVNLAALALPGRRAARLSTLGGAQAGLEDLLSVSLSRRDLLRPAAASQARTQPPSVLLIVLDTLRADHLSSYGYARATTPNLDAFAVEGTLFEHAYATAPWTLPSHASLMTGRYTYEHQATLSPLDARFPTLAEHFSAHGYVSGGFVANRSYTNWATGLGRGFQVYDDYYDSLADMASRTALGGQLLDGAARLGLRGISSRKLAEDVNRGFLRWLGSVGPAPFFAFLNYFDVHYPYLPPAPFDTRFTDRPLGYTIKDNMLGPRRESSTLSDEELQAMIAAYDGSLAYLDAQIGLLFGRLRDLGLFNNTLVVITSDHGEAFGEHGQWGHGSSLYREQVQVPLIVRYPPSVPSATRVSCAVDLQALPATVTHLLGAELADSPFPGTSLHTHWAAGDQHTSCAAFSELYSYGQTFDGRYRARKALTTSNWRLVVNKTGQLELYRAHEDTAEAQDLAPSPEGQQALQALLPRLVPYLSAEDWKGFNLPDLQKA
jgi:arylsulfatase A-like enzyme